MQMNVISESKESDNSIKNQVIQNLQRQILHED